VATIMKSGEAREAILRGEAPAGLVVEGSLHLYKDLKWLPDDLTVPSMYLQNTSLTTLPKGLRCPNLHIWNSQITELPDDLVVEDALDLHDCPNITQLPAGLRLRWLTLQNLASLAQLPEDLQVVQSLRVSQCPQLQGLPAHSHVKWLSVASSERLPGLPTDMQVKTLTVDEWPTLRELPAGLKLESLSISQCEQLTRLPDDLQTQRLGIYNCPRLEVFPTGFKTLSLQLKGALGLTALPDDLRVAHTLLMSDCAWLTSLPPDLGLMGTLDVSGCTALERLPDGLRLIALNARGCSRLTALPDDLRVTQTLDLTDCANLETLPAGLDVHTLNLTNCTSLRALPDDLRVTELTISGCTSLTTWPSGGLSPRLRRLAMRDCPGLTEWPKNGPPTLRTLDIRGNTRIRDLPPWLRAVDELNVVGCRNLERLPEKLRVASWLDLAATGLRRLPPSARGFRLRWRGVAIDARSAFYPETINGKEILKERNAEVRRVMLERVGYEQFLRQVEAETLDQDEDAGGPRRLLRVAMGQDEPLVCLAVHDPSTGRQYLLRTPPSMTTCHQAAAWIAGFDDPDDYHPLAET
jgi:uncharacterized protein DUF6745